MSDPNRTTPNDATVEADRTDADAPHDADRPATDTEAEAAPDELDESVREHHKEANERGAAVRGEGAIDGSS